MAAMLAVLMARNWEARGHDGFRLVLLVPSFMKVGQLIRKLLAMTNRYKGTLAGMTPRTWLSL
jgi:hypothetical protein